MSDDFEERIRVEREARRAELAKTEADRAERQEQEQTAQKARRERAAPIIPKLREAARQLQLRRADVEALFDKRPRYGLRDPRDGVLAVWKLKRTPRFGMRRYRTPKELPSLQYWRADLIEIPATGDVVVRAKEGPLLSLEEAVEAKGHHRFVGVNDDYSWADYVQQMENAVPMIARYIAWIEVPS